MSQRPRFGREYIRNEFERIDQRLNNDVTAFLIGGGSMSLRNLKDTTKDIDLVVTDDVAYDRLLASLRERGYTEVTDLGEDYQKLGARLCVENGDGCRIDVFYEQIANKLLFSEGMRTRSEELATHERLSVRLASLDDIFLFKTVAKRPDDIDDMATLVQTNLNFEAIEGEIEHQVTLLGGERFTTHIFDSLNKLEARHGIQTPLFDAVTEMNDRYMRGLEVRMKLDETVPTTLETLVSELKINEGEVRERLEYLERYGFVERAINGFVDTGERDRYRE